MKWSLFAWNIFEFVLCLLLITGTNCWTNSQMVLWFEAHGANVLDRNWLSLYSLEPKSQDIRQNQWLHSVFFSKFPWMICSDFPMVVQITFTYYICKREQKHIFTFYAIHPHWYDTGSWNTSSNKIRAYLFYIVNIMAADVLVTPCARASAAMVLT